MSEYKNNRFIEKQDLQDKVKIDLIYLIMAHEIEDDFNYLNRQSYDSLVDLIVEAQVMKVMEL